MTTIFVVTIVENTTNTEGRLGFKYWKDGLPNVKDGTGNKNILLSSQVSHYLFIIIYFLRNMVYTMKKLGTIL